MADAFGKIFEKATKEKDPISQTIIANMYYMGIGVEQNIAKSIEFFTLAANQNEPRALCELGNMHRWGVGLNKDYAKTVEYY